MFDGLIGLAAQVQAGAAMGLKRYILPVPVLSPRLSSYWLIFFTPVPHSIASALVEGLKSETILQNDHAARYYPQIRPLNFTQAVAAAELDLAHNQVVSRWCDSSANKTCDIDGLSASSSPGDSSGCRYGACHKRRRSTSMTGSGQRGQADGKRRGPIIPGKRGNWALLRVTSVKTSHQPQTTNHCNRQVA